MLGKDSSYLRVLTPRTIDGMNVKYDDQRQVMFKETHLPVTARKYLLEENMSLPEHLHHKIEEVAFEVAPAQTKKAPTMAELQAQFDILQKRMAEMSKQNAPMDTGKKAVKATAEAVKEGEPVDDLF